MKQLARIFVIGLTAVLMPLLVAWPASAEQLSQGRTYGATAYGVTGEVTVRRPGLASGRYYYGLVGAKSIVKDKNGAYLIHVAGFRANSSGTVERYARFQRKDGTNETILGGSISTSSGQRILTRLLNEEGLLAARDQFGYLGGHLQIFDEGKFDTVFVRLNMTQDNVSLSQSGHYFLNWQTREASYTEWKLGNYPLAPWGSPVAVALSSGACGRFEGTNTYFSAFYASC